MEPRQSRILGPQVPLLPRHTFSLTPLFFTAAQMEIANEKLKMDSLRAMEGKTKTRRIDRALVRGGLLFHSSILLFLLAVSGIVQ